MRKIQISDHFGISTILLFALPSIGMQLVDNTYQVADGYFISNYIGSSAFAAESLIFPPLAIVAGVGMMFGSGAAALISHTLGEGDRERANRQLGTTIGILAAVAVLLSLLLYLLVPWLAVALGASEKMAPLCVEYARILAICMPFQILNGAFHPLLITADRPGLGLLVSVVNACMNILLDWIVVAKLGWGMKGAALATGLAWITSAMIPLFWFMSKRRPLHFGAFRWNGGELGKICYNGTSEMIGALSFALIAMLFNGQLLRYAQGESGVDAYAVCTYAGGVIVSVFFGISMSITPVVGYHLGENNREELRGLRLNGCLLMVGLGFCMAALCYAFAWQIAGFFVGYDQALTELSVEALRIISFTYVISGLTTFSSAFFTGMGDGHASLAVAMVKGFAAPLACLLILPRLFGLTGIWFVTPLAECFALMVACVFWTRYKKKGVL